MLHRVKTEVIIDSIVRLTAEILGCRIAALKNLVVLATLLMPIAGTTDVASLRPPFSSHSLVPIFRFDGALRGFVEEPPYLTVGSSFTIEAWVAINSRTPWTFITGKPHTSRSEDPYFQWALGFEGDPGDRPSFIQTTGEYGTYWGVFAEESIPLNTWVHIAGVVDSGLAKLFVNGEFWGESSSAGPPPSPSGTPLGVGLIYEVETSQFCCEFLGSIRNVRLWDHALNSSELVASASSVAPPPLQGLLHAWNLNEAKENHAVDSVTGKDLLAPNGMPLYWEAQFAERPPNLVERIEIDSLSPDPVALWPIDLQGDGDIDIFVNGNGSGAPSPDHEEANTPVGVLENVNGSFRNSTGTLLNGSPTMVHPRDFAVADFNSDGRDDILVADQGWDNPGNPGSISRMFIQQSDGSLTDETQARIPQDSGYTHSVAAADVDSDDDIDVLFCDLDEGVKLWLNDGTGVFSIDSSEKIPSEFQYGPYGCLIARFADFDRDNDPDLFMASFHGLANPCCKHYANEFYLENVDGRFVDRSSMLPAKIGWDSGQPADQQLISPTIRVADINRDGWVDVVLAMTYGYEGASRFQTYLNDQSGGFTSLEYPNSETSFASWAFDIYPINIDGDGIFDWLVRTNEGSELLHGKSFQETEGVSDRLLFLPNHLHTLPVDMDGDGIHELIEVHKDHLRVFRFNESLRELLGSPPVANIVAEELPGTYYDADRDGEGCQLTLERDSTTFILSCYFYRAGEQFWLIGQGELVDDQIAFTDLILTDGAQYGNAFDSADVKRTIWGSAKMSWSDCNNAKLVLNPLIPGYEAFAFYLTRIVPTTCGSGGVPGNEASWMGAYYDPKRDGEGFHFGVEAGSIFVMTWYTYLNGKQVWLIGTGTRAGQQVLFDDMVITHGGHFGSLFKPTEVVRETFGQILVDFSDCNNFRAEVDSKLQEFHDLELNVTKIVPGNCND